MGKTIQLRGKLKEMIKNCK